VLEKEEGGSRELRGGSAKENVGSGGGLLTKKNGRIGKEGHSENNRDAKEACAKGREIAKDLKVTNGSSWQASPCKGLGLQKRQVKGLQYFRG